MKIIKKVIKNNKNSNKIIILLRVLKIIIQNVMNRDTGINNNRLSLIMKNQFDVFVFETSKGTDVFLDAPRKNIVFFNKLINFI